MWIDTKKYLQLQLCTLLQDIPELQGVAHARLPPDLVRSSLWKSKIQMPKTYRLSTSGAKLIHGCPCKNIEMLCTDATPCRSCAPLQRRNPCIQSIHCIRINLKIVSENILHSRLMHVLTILSVINT